MFISIYFLYVFIYFEWPKVNINKGRGQNKIDQTDDTLIALW